MMYNGFKGLSTEFISHHAAHYIVPVHVTGSCIESLFSRFMYNANGNLSAVNYETAMSRILTADAVSNSNKDKQYRSSDVHVYGQLKRKNKSSKRS